MQTGERGAEGDKEREREREGKEGGKKAHWRGERERESGRKARRREVDTLSLPGYLAGALLTRLYLRG